MTFHFLCLIKFHSLKDPNIQIHNVLNFEKQTKTFLIEQNNKTSCLLIFIFIFGKFSSFLPKYKCFY
jgi:hypothetical protein